MIVVRQRMQFLISWKNLTEVGRLADLAEICRALLRIFMTRCHSFTDWRQRYLDEHMKHIFFLILTALAFLACNTPEAPKKYSFDCYARFDEQAAKTTAEASWKEGVDNPVPAEPPGGIRYQKTDMKLVPVQGITYQYAYPAGYTRDHLFQWKTAAGKSMEFTLQMPALDSIYFEPKVLSRRQPARFFWKGAALERGEALVFMWENAARNLTIPIELYNTGGATSIEFPAVKIAELPPGDWTYYVVRKKLQKATIDGVSVNGVSEYYTKAQAMKVL